MAFNMNFNPAQNPFGGANGGLNGTAGGFNNGLGGNQGGMPGMNSMMGMQSQMMAMLNMTMMAMMTQLMQTLVGGTGMAGGQSQFGGGGASGASPLGDFLGGTGGTGNSGSAGSASGGTAATGSGASLGPTDGSTNAKTKKFIDLALSKQGTPYVFGAAGPDKFDCSGLVSWALKEAGVSGGRTTARGLQERYAGSAITKKEDLKPGDLVFFHSSNTRGIPKGKASHVEIYLGNGKTMGTDSPKEGAKVEPIDWNTFIGGARVPELNR